MDNKKHLVTRWLWCCIGLAIGAVGGIFPDAEKLWNGWQRGAWHNPLVPFIGIGVSLTLILYGLVKPYLRRCK